MTWQQNAVNVNFTARARFSTATVGNRLTVVGGDQGDQQVFGGALLIQPLSSSSSVAAGPLPGNPDPTTRQPAQATNSLSTSSALRVTTNGLVGVVLGMFCGLLVL